MTLEERIEELERITGAITEVHNTKMDLDAHNIQNPSAVVIESQMPTSANNYTWYRKYSDGWVEQGGIMTSGQGDMTITFPVEMRDIFYTPSAIAKNNSGIAGSFCMIDGNDSSRSTTRCMFIVNFQGSQPGTKTIFWQVSGKYAI